MEKLLDKLTKDDWLICDHSQELPQIATELYLKFTQLSNPKIIILELKSIFKLLIKKSNHIYFLFVDYCLKMHYLDF